MSSGKFLVRMDEFQHSWLKTLAFKQNLSLNELCVRRLSSPSCLEHFSGDLLHSLLLLEKHYGENIRAVLLFGSWARGDIHDRSDIDVLVVMNPDQKISRDLYRSWEEHCDVNTKVEPNFIALPKQSDRISSLWAEMAMSALVLYDPTLEAQRYLNHVKNMIIEGKIIRKKTHGQYYWIHEDVA